MKSILKTISKKLGLADRKSIARALVSSTPVTGDPPRATVASNITNLYQGLPPLTWWIIEQMRIDEQVALGMSVRNGLLSHLEVEIDEERVCCPKARMQSEWALRNWNLLWEQHGKQLRQTKLAGHAAFEMFYKQGQFPNQIDILRIKALHPTDVRPLRQNGKTVGSIVRSRNNMMSFSLAPTIMAPKILWTTYNSRYDSAWGESVFRPAQRAWQLKWMDHGVEELTTIWYVKYAATGRILWVGEGLLEEDENGDKFPMMDLLRGIAENELSLGTVTLPLKLDENGKELIRYERPDIPSATNPFEWWSDNTGLRIWKGLGILPEVIEALGTGSFSGRSIPLIAMLDLLMDEAREIFSAVCSMVFDPICTLMDGGEPMYAIKLVPLKETMGSSVDRGDEQTKDLDSGLRPLVPNEQGIGNQFAEDEGPDSTSPEADSLIKTASGLAAAKLLLGKRQVIDLLKKKEPHL